MDSITSRREVFSACWDQGQTLCPSSRINEAGEVEAVYVLEPSGEYVARRTALAAIESGVLLPVGEGRFAGGVHVTIKE